MSPLQSKAHAHKARGHDFYATAPEAVAALLRVEPDLPHILWEPACGDGAIVMPLRASGRHVLATDLVDWGCPGSIAGIDFLQQWPDVDSVGGIVTNPPYKLARAFVTVALKRKPYVAMLLRLSFLEGAGRQAWFEASPLARVHVSSRRIPMMHRNGWAGPKATSAVCHAWFIWQAGHQGPPAIHWFDWRA